MSKETIPDIIDNDKEDKFLNYLKKLLQDSYRSRIASGYFYLNGFDLVKEDLQHYSLVADPEYEKYYHSKSPFLLIIGDETNKPTKEEIDEGYKQRELFLRSDSLSKKEILKLDTLRDFIKNQIIDVRIYTEEKFHSKAYIFDRKGLFSEPVAIIGSSNFTRPGLTMNSELNSVHRQTSSVELIEKWFYKKWNRSKPYSPDLIKIIESLPEYQQFIKKSKYVYLDPLVFIKTLIKKFGLEYFLNRDEILLPFQIADYNQARSILSSYGGVILSHSVGLGKSFVASKIIQDSVNKGEKVLLICPPTLWSDDNWKGYLTKGFKISPSRIKFLSLYQLSNEKFDPKKYSNFDLILIDEAHHFRNGNLTRRYQNLRKMINPKADYVLITATPVNNSPMDLKNIIDIFKDEQRFKKDNLILNYNALEEYSKKRQKKQGHVTPTDYKFIQKNIGDLTKKLIVKTTRKDLKKMYGDGMVIKGKTIQFKDPITTVVEYNLQHNTYNWIFDNIVNFLTSLDLPHLTIINPTTGQFLEGLYKLLLYKRLESSIHAFYTSILNLKQKEQAFKEVVKKIPISEIRTFESKDLLKQMSKAYEDTTLFQFLDPGTQTKSEKIQKKEILRQIDTDLIEIDKFIEKLELVIGPKKFRDSNKKSINSYFDDKINELITNQLPKYKNKKILLFTQFKDTAEYLWSQLKPLEKNDYKIELVTGMISNKAPIIEKFKKDKNIKILIATDAISEGVNIAEADIVINYDLPWSVLTLIQRQGRTLRLESSKQIQVLNFIPDKQIDFEINLVRNLKKKIQDIIYIIGLEFAIFSPEETQLIQKLEKEGKDIERLKTKIDAIRKNRLDELEEESHTSKLSNFHRYLLQIIDKYDIQQKDLNTIKIPTKIFYTKIKSSKRGKLFLYEVTYSNKLTTDYNIKYQTSKYELHDDVIPMWHDLSNINDDSISDQDQNDINNFEEHISEEQIQTISSYSETIGKQQDVDRIKNEIFQFMVKELSHEKMQKKLSLAKSPKVERLETLVVLFREKNPSEIHLPILKEFKKNVIKSTKHGDPKIVNGFSKLVKNIETTARDLVTHEDISSQLIGFVIEK